MSRGRCEVGARICDWPILTLAHTKLTFYYAEYKSSADAAAEDIAQKLATAVLPARHSALPDCI